MRVAKWGNSLAVRLPAKLVERLGVKEGDEISITATGEREIEIEKAPSNEALLAGLEKYRGLIPADYKFKREDAYDED